MPDLIEIGRAGSRREDPEPPEPRPGFEPLPAGLRTYRIETWGCQMNEHDSEKMAGALQSMGLAPARGEHDADLILLNTCSVREKAAHKVFTRLGQLRRHKVARPGMLLGVCGCVAQQEQARIFARAPYVDLVMGPRHVGALADLIRSSLRAGRAMGVLDARDALVPEIAGSAVRVSRTCAYVTVMEGCNKNCTFCIVPFTRGREACRSPESILREVADCVQEGRVEVELLGQNVNAWRYGGPAGWDFARLLRTAAQVPGLQRLRFTTSHPLHFKNSIIDVMAGEPAICRHLHLPMQSGSDRILDAMRRGYTRQEYLDRIDHLRRRVAGVALSTDVIVGFPGETEEDFRQTLQTVREARFDVIYSFIYSPRPGTPAEALPDDVPLQMKQERLRRLQELQDRIQLERNRAWEGSLVDVLVDGPARRAGQVSGRTSQNQVVNLQGDPSLVGTTLRVRIDRAGRHSLSGTAVNHLTSPPHRHIDGGGISV